MASHSIINPGPERGNKYDDKRHQEMKLRSLGMFGIPKFFFRKESVLMACEKCVFDSGIHSCAQNK
jgi:hypothetical protein